MTYTTRITTPTTADEILSALTTDCYALNSLMEFEHVIHVREDGTVSDAPYPGERQHWAPEMYDGELLNDEWSLMNGYSGQDRYSGPSMHASEFIGGGMARDILTTPGLYVAVLDMPAPCGGEYCEDGADDDEGCTCEPDGWGVAYREA